MNKVATGCILLGGLFFYDIFWVFGTNVMVTVAKSFDAPIKLVFPQVGFSRWYTILHLRMIHCLASAKPWLGKKSPKLGPKLCRGTSNFFISRVCSKKFKYWQINYMRWVKNFLSVGIFLNIFFA